MTGWYDLQVNGWGGVDFSSPELTEAEIRTACRAIRATGTESFLATVVTAPPTIYHRNLPLLAAVIDSGEPGPVGIHCEGPFFRADGAALGVHDPAACSQADPALLDEMLRLSGGHLRLLTIGADLPGASGLCAAAVERGVVVSLGHHEADVAQIAACAEAGARLLTHLGNGLPHLIDRHRNPIWAALAETRLTAMLIADGHHLPEAMLRSLLAALGPERVILVSDAAPFGGCTPGRYSWLGREIELEAGGRLGDPVSGYLAGSSACLGDCVAHLRSLGFDDDLVAAWASSVAQRLVPVPGRSASAS